MATESPKQRSDEATLTSAAELTIKIDTDSQNVDLNRPHVNGDAPASATDEFENKHISDIVDDLVNSTEVSISGGSDTEAAKSDASKSRDSKGTGRASSAVKKPASFKAINVNKTFLTSKGSSAPGTQPRPTEKVVPPTTTSPAPTGTPTTSRPRLVAKTGSGLVSKGVGSNGAKPAPDGNAVWNKNRPAPPPEPKKYTDEELKKYGIHMATRLQTDDSKGQQSNWADIDDDDDDWAPDTFTWKDGTKIAIAPAEEHTPPAPEPPARTIPEKNEPAEKTKAAVSPAPTSIKPGVLASGKGLVLKGAPEKPTLVAKPPPPPTPAKSPWAPLPKLDKVSPIAAEAPTQAGPRFPPRDVPMPQPHMQPPPKEIAADDFSRAPWREGAPGANRELFNSQSGRYEPVLDRRGPMRPEPQHGRQPALLQRPHYEQHGPMDHPGPFQAGRANEQQGPYGRRRGSSNVSGGSGSWQRLKSLEHPLPPPELLNARRTSMAGESDSPASPRNFSPSGLQGGSRHGQAWQPRASPGTAHATPYHQGAPGPDGRGMPPPVQPPPSAPSAASVTEDDYELQKRLMRERRELAMRRRQEEEAKEEAARRERIRLKLEALGPAPESNKAKKAAVQEQVPTPTQIQARETNAVEKSTPTGPQAAEKDTSAAVVPESAKQPAPHSNGPPARAPQQPDGVESHAQAHGPSQAHPWAPSRQPDRHPAVWGPQPSTKNVWAAPNNNRTLGNGTFAADIGTSQLPSGPGPIAPPSQAPVAPTAPRQPPIGPPRQTQGARATDREMKDNPWAAAVRLNDDKFSEMLNAQYDERDCRLQAEGRSLTEIQPAIKDTWRPTKLDDNGVRTEATSKQTLQIGQENPWAASVDSVNLQTVPSGPSEYNQLSQGNVPGRDMASTTILSTKTTAGPGRGSRFFPSREVRHENRDIRLETSTEALRHESPSPPPPDMDGHPAFDGDATHPHVSLPRPYPVVRLPPSASRELQASAPATQSKPQGPSFGWATQAAYKESDNAPRGPAQKPDNTWQAKIDNLLGGRKVHPSRATAADARVSQYHDPSFPGASMPSEMDGSATTKVMAEECFEEQEMGSVPPIRLPKAVPEMAWQPSPAPKPLGKKFWPTVLSADAISFPVDVSGAGTVWRVRFPGLETKTITIPFGRTRSNPRRGPRGGRHNSSGHRQGKGRDASSTYSAEQGANASGSNSHGRNHRGNYRGRDNWSRNTATQIQT